MWIMLIRTLVFTEKLVYSAALLAGTLSSTDASINILGARASARTLRFPHARCLNGARIAIIALRSHGPLMWRSSANIWEVGRSCYHGVQCRCIFSVGFGQRSQSLPCQSDLQCISAEPRLKSPPSDAIRCSDAGARRDTARDDVLLHMCTAI